MIGPPSQFSLDLEPDLSKYPPTYGWPLNSVLCVAPKQTANEHVDQVVGTLKRRFPFSACDPRLFALIVQLNCARMLLID